MRDLVAALMAKEAVLFAGAGLSTGLGAPPWSGLVTHMAEDLGYDPDIFTSNGTSFWTLGQYYKIVKGRIGPLRTWMDKSWYPSDDAIRASEVHAIIGRVGFQTIYTTNYDSNIERSLALAGIGYSKIINVKDFSTSKRDEVHVIKLHGDFEDDSSIVIAENDYFARLSFESPLDVRLRADAIGRTLLFVGYSFTDFNIRYLLYKLSQTWASSGYGSERPKSYIFLTRPDPIQETVLKSWGVDPIVADNDDPGIALRDFLLELEKTTLDAKSTL